MFIFVYTFPLDCVYSNIAILICVATYVAVLKPYYNTIRRNHDSSLVFTERYTSIESGSTEIGPITRGVVLGTACSYIVLGASTVICV